jgi:hypothetical protein
VGGHSGHKPWAIWIREAHTGGRAQRRDSGHKPWAIWIREAHTGGRAQRRDSGHKPWAIWIREAHTSGRAQRAQAVGQMDPSGSDPLWSPCPLARALTGLYSPSPACVRQRRRTGMKTTRLAVCKEARCVQRISTQRLQRVCLQTRPVYQGRKGAACSLTSRNIRRPSATSDMSVQFRRAIFCRRDLRAGAWVL